MDVRLTDRDVQILVKCAVCRWLTTAQIQRLYFKNATLNAVQKRLRKLADSGHLRSNREHATAEAIHSVGPKGRLLIEEKGIDVAQTGEVPGHIEHLLGVNEIRTAIESNAIQICFCFAYLDLPRLGWQHPVIPDLVFAVHDGQKKRTFLVEYDRGTETLGKLFEKLVWYDKGLSGFRFESVLIVAETARRLDLLSRALRRKGLELEVLASTLPEIRNDFFNTQFVVLPDGGKRCLSSQHVLTRGDGSSA